VLLLAFLACVPQGLGQGESGLRFDASRIVLSFAEPHPLHPDPEVVAATAEVRLIEVDRVLYAPGAAPESGERRDPIERRATVAEIGTRFAARLDASAVAEISRAVVRAMGDLGIGAVRVAPDPAVIGAGGEDLRLARSGPLPFVISTARVSGIRTVAAGDRFEAGAIDHPAHERFLRGSPVEPSDGDAGGPGERDLLLTDELDSFLARINRHPGRFARAVVGPDGAGRGLALDLVISEAKPWIAYAQLSNTGTEATGELRYRAGFVHNQLTGNDDSLAFSYVASGLGSDPDFRAVQGSYEARVGSSDRLRWRVSGSWREFSAAELGRDEDAFLGETGTGSVTLIATLAQFGEVFLDLEAGLRIEDFETRNVPAAVSGSEEMVIASAGIVLERVRFTDELFASVAVEGTRGSWTASDELGLTELGRVDPSEDWVAIVWDASYSFYIEPAFDRAAWEDPSTPESSTLAHEVALSMRGQWSLDHRLVPQQQGVLGGLYSVRGYPQSVAAGDSSVAFSAEYRFHVPRSFGVRPDPMATPLFGRPFRVAPAQVYGAPDWDLVLKGFVDGGRVWQSDRRSFENDETLLSVGAGVELSLRNNIRARVDYAVATTRVATGGRVEQSAGDGELHFAVTVSY